MARGPIKRVIYNQKGGVGKTTLAVNLAACSALAGKRTLLIDTDPQGNSTNHLIGPDIKLQTSIADFYESCLGINIFRQSIYDYVTESTGVHNLHLVASTRKLEELRNKLENKHKILKLRDGLPQSEYDAIYFDPPPANDFFALSSLIAADEILVPIDCDAFSIRAAQDILEIVKEVQMDHNPNLKMIGLVVNQFQKSTNHSAAIVEKLGLLGLEILQPYIPTSIKIRESHSEFSPAVCRYPTHSVAKAFLDLYNEIEMKSQGVVVKKKSKSKLPSIEA